MGIKPTPIKRSRRLPEKTYPLKVKGLNDPMEVPGTNKDREYWRLLRLDPKYKGPWDSMWKMAFKTWTEPSVRGVLRCWETGCVCTLGERDEVVCKEGSGLQLEVTTEDKTMFRVEEADPESEDPDKKFPVGDWVKVDQVEKLLFNCTKYESRKGEPTHCPVHDFEGKQKPTMKIEIGKGNYKGFLFYRCSEGCAWKEIELGIQRKIVQGGFPEWDGQEAFFAKREKEVRDGKR